MLRNNRNKRIILHSASLAWRSQGPCWISDVCLHVSASLINVSWIDWERSEILKLLHSTALEKVTRHFSTISPRAPERRLIFLPNDWLNGAISRATPAGQSRYCTSVLQRVVGQVDGGETWAGVVVQGGGQLLCKIPAGGSERDFAHCAIDCQETIWSLKLLGCILTLAAQFLQARVATGIGWVCWSDEQFGSVLVLQDVARQYVLLQKNVNRRVGKTKQIF